MGASVHMGLAWEWAEKPFQFALKLLESLIAHGMRQSPS